jgi:hypothetical protein
MFTIKYIFSFTNPSINRLLIYPPLNKFTHLSEISLATADDKLVAE